MKKCQLKLIRKLLQENVILKLNVFCRNKLNKLPTKDPMKLFSEARKYYGNNYQHQIELMRLSQNRINLLQRISITLTDLEMDINCGNYITKDRTQILDVFKTYLKKIYANKDVAVENTVMDIFTRLLEEKSEYDNISLNTMWHENFTTDDELIYIFKHLKGKVSSRIDNIPNLVLKNGEMECM